jgi:hypothetical protein
MVNTDSNSFELLAQFSQPFGTNKGQQLGETQPSL